MSNILKFPKRPQAQSRFNIDFDTIKTALRPRVSLVGVLAWLWAVVRMPLFLVLYWLRIPVVGLCNLVSVPALLAFLFGLFLFPEHREMVWAVGGVSFAAFSLHFAYDCLLLWISPMDLTFSR